MEQWNEENEERRYSLDEIYTEIYFKRNIIKDLNLWDSDMNPNKEKPEHIKFIEKYQEKQKESWREAEEYKKNYMEQKGKIENFENVRKQYAKRLNDMFVALFGRKYAEVFEKKSNRYIIYKPERDLIKFLIECTYSPDGRSIIKGDFQELDFLFKCDLVEYTNEFFKSGRYEEKKADMLKNFCEKLVINEPQKELLDAFIDFKTMIAELIVDDDEMIQAHFSEIAKKIDNFAVEILDSFSFA